MDKIEFFISSDRSGVHRQLKAPFMERSNLLPKKSVYSRTMKANITFGVRVIRQDTVEQMVELPYSSSIWPSFNEILLEEDRDGIINISAVNP